MIHDPMSGVISIYLAFFATHLFIHVIPLVLVNNVWSQLTSEPRPSELYFCNRTADAGTFYAFRVLWGALTTRRKVYVYP